MFNNEAKVNCMFKWSINIVQLSMRQSTNIIIINVIDERARFFDVCEAVFINIDNITISISVFVVKRSDHELFLKRLFQHAARMSSINMNNESLEIILHSLNEKKRVSFLKMSAEHVNKKKFSVRNEVFKHLNNDLINVFVRKFKFDHHELSEAKVKSFQIIYKVSFKTAQLSRDFDSFINHDFLSIRLKCSRNDWFDVTSINRVLSSRKSFIFQQFQMNRRSRMTTHCLSHRFSRKFDILNRARIINVHVDILYKRKV